MSKFGIFFEPEPRLGKFINDCKRRVDLVLPNQPYCNHPPHSTVFCTWLKEIDKVDFVLEELSFQESSIRYLMRDNMCFYDDALTGGHTVALKIDDPSGAIRDFQIKIAGILSGFIDFGKVPEASGFLLSEPFKSSYGKFAFPFVGAHWIPHMTIASLRVERNNPLLLSLLESEFEFEGVFHQFSLVEIEGDVHSLIKTYNLT